MKCPFPHHALRAGLPPVIPQMAHLPIDARGYPVPFFVSWINGEPEFRMADPKKFRQCREKALCWVCGKTLRQPLTFLIGPMCCINRTTAEPPAHAECAEWSARACPFLSKPQMVRREDELTDSCAGNVSGFSIRRNPGVSACWHTRIYKWFPDHQGGELIELGEPEKITFWREGRPATEAEVMESVDTGIPLLEKACDEEQTQALVDEARAELRCRYEDFRHGVRMAFTKGENL